MSTSFTVSEADYVRASVICSEWIEDYTSSYECGGTSLLYSFDQITNGLPAMRIKDLRPFGDLLGRLDGNDLVHIIKVLLAHINNPNFILKNGTYKGRTFLQGVIETENKSLIELVLSNKHGSKIFEISEPVIIDHDSWLILKRDRLFLV